MQNDICLDFIIALIKVHKTERNSVVDGTSCIRGAHYLLGQIVRQYAIPEKNYYISKKAKALWDQISDENIWNYVYTDKFLMKQDYKLPRYVGAEKTPRETKVFKKGEKVEFKSVFHDEHIISIKEILNQLDEIPKNDLNHDSVKKILDSIVICRILKEEDKNLARKRYNTFKENYEKVYKPQGVVLINAANEYSKRHRIDK